MADLLLLCIDGTENDCKIESVIVIKPFELNTDAMMIPFNVGS